MELEIKHKNDTPQTMEDGVWYIVEHRQTNTVRVAQRQENNNFTHHWDSVIFLNRSGVLSYDSYDNIIDDYIVLQKVNKITIE